MADFIQPLPAMSDLILYTTEDGSTAIQLRAEEGTVWLTQAEMADLFATTKQNISLHIKNILAEGELGEATVKDSLTVQTEGSRQVRRTAQLYNLDMILAVGYRVRSPRGTQFRQWATTQLREFLVKGFVMDDQRLKNPGGWDYFACIEERNARGTREQLEPFVLLIGSASREDCSGPISA